MERRYGQARRVWVMDRGMTSAETVAFLQSTQRHYLIGASKSELKKLPAACRRPRLAAGARRGRGQAVCRPRR
jgi:hypothetical protein